METTPRFLGRTVEQNPDNTFTTRFYYSNHVEEMLPGAVSHEGWTGLEQKIEVTRDFPIAALIQVNEVVEE